MASSIAGLFEGSFDSEIAELLINDGSQAPRDNPQQQTQSSKAVTYGDDNVDLPEELQTALLRLIQEAEQQDLFQRRIEVMRDRRNRFYERGIQHIYEDMQSGLFVQATPGSVVPAPDGGQIQVGEFCANYNIFGRALQIIIAKLTENPVGVDFQPDSPDNTADLQASEAAEGYRLLYDRRNDIKDLLTAIVRMMGLSGRTVSWTRTVADEQKWGVDDNGEPRRVQVTTIYGTLENKVPIMAKCLGECPYILLKDDPHIYTAKIEYPKFADKIESQGDSGTGDTTFERMARIGALQGASAAAQITDTYEWYVERTYAFFRPAMCQSKALDGPFGAGGGTLRDALKAAFPDGALVTFVGQVYVGSKNQSPDDCLWADFPYAGDGMSRPAIMDPAVPIQDDFNDDQNNYHEVKTTGWPSTWVNEDYSDLAAVNDQVAAPYCFRALKSRPSRDAKMQDQFFREPNPEIPASFMQHTEYMATQLLQFILAIPSAVQGAGMPDQKTASGYTAALQQALGQLGVIWGAVQRMMANVYRQAALCAARDSQEQRPIVIPGQKGKSITVSIGDLGKGRFLCHPDVDSGYPESTIQKRGTLSQIFEMAATSPQVAEALFQSPDNWDFFARTMGIPEITLPEARARRKQVAEIELLLKGAPVPPSPEAIQQLAAEHAAQTMQAHAQGGAPPQPFSPDAMLTSSIQPEELDFHEWELEECREFLSDWPKIQQQVNQGNEAGVQNVRLHAQEHQKFIQQKAAQAMQMQAAAQPQPKPAGQPAPSAP